jgi:hypothetical protein
VLRRRVELERKSEGSRRQWHADVDDGNDWNELSERRSDPSWALVVHPEGAVISHLLRCY